MVSNDEQNWARELQESRAKTLNNPGKDDPPEEEEPEEISEEVEGPEAERRARRALLTKKRASLMAQRIAGRVAELGGKAARTLAWGLRRIGQLLVQFALGLGLTIIGLIFGVPLLIIGLPLIVLGILGGISAKAVEVAGKAIKKRAKKAALRGGKAAGGSMGEGGVETVKKILSLILVPIRIIGCSLAGFLLGIALMAVIIVAIMSAVLDIF